MTDYTKNCRHSGVDNQGFCRKCGEKVCEANPTVLTKEREKGGRGAKIDNLFDEKI